MERISDEIGAFQIEGIDPKTGTVLVEIHRSVLGASALALSRIRPNDRNRVHLGCWALANHLRNAASVLYGQRSASDFGFTILDPVEDDDMEDMKD